MPTLQEALSPDRYLPFASRGYEAVLTAAISDFAGLVQETQRVPTVYNIKAAANVISWEVTVPDGTSPQGWSTRAYSPDAFQNLDSSEATISPAFQIYRLVSDSSNYSRNSFLGQDTCLYYWCSPPQPEKYASYTEARVEIGLLSRDPVTGECAGQAISNIAPHWTQNDCIFWQEWFSHVSSPTLDQVRNSPLVLHPPSGVHPVAWFASLIGDPGLAQAFLDGSLDSRQKEILSQISAQAVLFANAVCEAARTGNSHSRPPALKKELTCIAGASLESACITADSKSHERHYVLHCGSCGLWIGKVISAGFVCPRCHQVYAGC